MSDIETEGAKTFQVSGESYDRFMGRYSIPLAVAFADAAGVEGGRRVLDVGSGPGALTGELVRRLGPDRVAAVDPSEPFVEACRRRHPGVEVKRGRAEELPYPDGAFDAALAQLVLHFVSDPDAAAKEMHRVVRTGGTVAACVWDLAGGMLMLQTFWQAVRAVDPSTPVEDEARRFGGREGEIAELFRSAGLADVADGALDVSAAYEDFDDFWLPFLTATGPAGAYASSLDDQRRSHVREEIRVRLGSPEGPFTLTARAWYATGRA
jgi:SAM-dependent methyltransferase